MLRNLMEQLTSKRFGARRKSHRQLRRIAFHRSLSRGLQVESLEDRYLLAGITDTESCGITSAMEGFAPDKFESTADSGVLVFNSDAAASNFGLSLDSTGQMVQITQDGRLLVERALSALTELTLNGNSLDNTLTVDLGNGNPIPAGGLFYNGGDQATEIGDAIQLVGGDSYETSYTPTVGNDGIITLTPVGSSANESTSIYFTSLEPVEDNMAATNLPIDGTLDGNGISYTNGPGGSIFVGATGLVAIDNFETYEFENKMNLILNGNAGDDVVTLNAPLQPTGLTGVMVNGGDDNDVFNLLAANVQNLAIDGNAGNNVVRIAGAAPGVFASGNITFLNTAVEFDLGGTMPGAGAGFHDQLNVAGNANIGNNVTLATRAFGDGTGVNFVPTVGDQFVIINNIGSEAVTGTFAGLPEGEQFVSPGTNRVFSITYGDGALDNDVVLTYLGAIEVEIATMANVTENGVAQDIQLMLSTPIALPSQVDVRVTPANISADDNDYDSTSFPKRVSFTDGSTNGATVNVQITPTADNVVEADETLRLDLAIDSGPAAVGTNGSSTVTILNDDSATLTLSSVSATNLEGDAGMMAFTFQVVLDNAVQGGLTLAYTTDDGTAMVADNDYVDNDGSLVFMGTAGETKTITVQVNGDTKVEVDEDFTVALGAISGLASGVPGGSSTISTAGSPQTGTINNDDMPTVTVDIVDTTLSDGDNSSNVTFTFSEATADFVLGDVTVSGGTLSAFSGSGTSYTATFTADDDLEGTGSVTVPAGSYTDAAGNAGTEGSDTVTIDTLNPTVTVDIVDMSLSDGDNSSSVTFTFSESTADFVLGDVTVSGGTLSAFSGDSVSYSATFTADDGLEGTGTVTVPAGSYTDAAGNLGAAGSDTVTIDTLNPMVTVDIVDTSLSDGDNSSNVTFTFSEATSDFVLGDVTVSGGTLSGFNGSGTSYTATFTADDGLEGTGSVTVPAGSYTDAAVNAGAAGSDTVTIDTLNPTVTVDIVDTTLSDGDNTSNVTFTFSEATSDFVLGDVTVSGGTLSVFNGSGTSYTATFTADDGLAGTGSVTVPAGSYTDAAGNLGAEGSDMVTIDTLNPTVTVDIVDASLSDGDNGSNVTFTFSEATADFVLGDVTVSGGTLSAFNGSGTSYTATFTADDGLEGTGSVTVPAGSYTDAAGNLGVEGSDTVTIDTLNPTVTVDIVDASLSDGDNSSNVTFTFSEATSDFVLGDVTVSGGTLLAFSGSGASYTATFTADDGLAGTGSVTVPAGSYTDAAGNLGAEGSDMVTIDTLNPTVTVDIVDASLSDGDNGSNVTFTFSEATADFVLGDVTVSGGTLSAFTGSGTSYTATFTADDGLEGTGSVTVPAGSYTDAASNLGVEGSDTVTIDTLNPTVTVDIVDASLSDGDNSSNVTFTFSEATSDFVLGDVTVSGGTLLAFSGSGASYTATFTADDGLAGTGSVTVPAGSYTDAAGNLGAEGSDMVTIDTLNPTVTVDIVDASLSDGDNGSNVTFTFSEATADFVLGDVTVSGGTLSAFTGSGTSYTATFTADDGLEGTGSVTVPAGSYTDAAGNLGAEGSDTVTIDTLNPTVTVDIVDASLSDGDNSSNVTFTFSEATSDFVLGDVTVSGGTLLAFSGSGANYTATFTADDGLAGTGSVTVPAGSYTDAAGNLGAEGSDMVTIDTLNPMVTVDIVDASLSDGDNSSNVTFTFSEATADFVLGDVTVSGGTLSAFTGSGTSYTATFTADDGLEGTGSVTVPAGSYTDAAGNLGAAGSDMVTIDTLNPTVTVDIVDTSLSDGDNSSNVTFTFSEATTDFVLGDVTVSGGTLSAFSGSGTSYTATFTADDGLEGTGSVTVPAGSYTDAAGNFGAAGSDMVTIDTLNPTVTVDIVDTSLSDGDNSSNVTFTFSEATTDFVLGDVTVSGGTLSAFTGSGTSYTATFTADDGLEGTGSVTVPAGSYTDAAGNLGVEGSDTVTIDTLNPTVTVDIVDASLSDGDNSSNVTFTFSEATADFVLGDVTVSGGTLSAFSGSGTSYTATFTADDGLEVTGSVTVPAGSYADAAGNLGAEGSDMVTIDTLNPTVTVDIVNSDGDNSSNVAFTFSEATTDFVLGDVTVSGGTLSAFNGSGTSYTATFTADDGLEGTGSVTVPAGSYTDAAGNLGAEGSDMVTIDTLNPTVTVDIVDTSLSDGDSSSNVTFTFSEATTDFLLGDITVSGGTLSAFSGSGTSYTATFTADDGLEGTGSVTVPAGSYTDAAGNAGAEGSDTVTIDTLNPTVTVDIVDASLSDGDNSSNVTFTFSEATSDFVLGDVTVSGGTLSAFSGSGASYTATFTADDGLEGAGSVTVPAGSYTDAAGNLGAEGSDTATIDTRDRTVTVADVSIAEGGGLLFTVTLDNAVQGAFTVDVTLTDVTATGGMAPLVTPEDYDNVVAQLNFNGTAGETQQFTVATLDDAVLEGPETFTVSLNASNALVDDSDTATGTITDNDMAAVTVADVSIAEGGGLLFTVTLDNAVQGAFTVDVTLTDVTATGGMAPLVTPEDYDNVVAQLNFNGTAGETQQFTVATLDDAVLEGPETFTVSLNASNALVDDSDTATGTITDNDLQSVRTAVTSDNASILTIRDVVPGGKDDQLVLTIMGDRLVITDQNNIIGDFTDNTTGTVVDVPLASILSVEIDLLEGDDQLSIDFRGALPDFNLSVTINGGGGHDTLRFLGPTPLGMGDLTTNDGVDDIFVNGPITTQGGTVTLKAMRDLEVNANINTGAGGEVRLTASQHDIFGNCSLIQAGTADVHLVAGTGIAAVRVQTTGDVTLNGGSGGIVGCTGQVAVSAQTLTLMAGASVGTALPIGGQTTITEPFRTSVNEIKGLVGGFGIFLVNDRPLTDNVVLRDLPPLGVRKVCPGPGCGSPEGEGSPLRNSVNSLDVNNDGTVSPVDVLAVFNFLNGHAASEGSSSNRVMMYVDVNGDYAVSPVDALTIINYLNRTGLAAEGESSAPGQVENEMTERPWHTIFNNFVSAAGFDLTSQEIPHKSTTAAAPDESNETWEWRISPSPIPIAARVESERGPALRRLLPSEEANDELERLLSEIAKDVGTVWSNLGGTE